MPVWLLSIITALVKPVIEKVIDEMLIAARLSAIEKKQAESKEAFDKLAKAKTVEEFREASKSISSSWNS